MYALAALFLCHALWTYSATTWSEEARRATWQQDVVEKCAPRAVPQGPGRAKEGR